MIKKGTIEEIKNAARVEEVIGEFVSLKRRGVNMIGLCPFHNEKTPSFTVSPSKGIYKCFGCGASGDAVRFLIEHEKYSYPEALRYLASKYNIPIEETELTEEQKEEDKERESLYVINQYAGKFFKDKLWNSDEGKSIGLSYFRNRGFTDEVIEKFELGYSPEKWDDLTATALNQGYKLTYLTQAGLTISKNNYNYDRFRNRVIFPIHNISGRIIGFGGRILSSDKKKPKYVNSPETVIYNKSKILYGIHFARTEISKQNNCFLVEGYTDVISLYQAGIKNVVASSGTSLTTDQIRLIKRYSENITILYDGDEAGIKASFRGIDMILEQGMNVKIVLFPEGEDPDSYASNHRSQQTQSFINEHADDFIVFKTNLLLKEVQNDPVRRANMIKDIIATISKIPDQIKRTIYISECASLLDMQEQTLMNELNTLLRQQYRKNVRQEDTESEKQKTTTSPTELKPPEQENIITQEKNIIRILLHYGHQNFVPSNQNNNETVNVAQAIVSDLADDEISFTVPVYQKIFDIYKNFIEEGVIKESHVIAQHEDKQVADAAINLLASHTELSHNWQKKHKIFILKEADILEKTIIHSILAFKLDKLQQKKHRLQKDLKEGQSGGKLSEDDFIIILQQAASIDRKIRLIAEQLGRIILE